MGYSSYSIVTLVLLSLITGLLLLANLSLWMIASMHGLPPLIKN